MRCTFRKVTPLRIPYNKLYSVRSRAIDKEYLEEVLANQSPGRGSCRGDRSRAQEVCTL